jgi:hypothetical protein
LRQDKAWAEGNRSDGSLSQGLAVTPMH